MTETARKGLDPSALGICVIEASVCCPGFMPRATSKTIPTTTIIIPEKNEAAGSHQYQGKEPGGQPLSGQYVFRL